MGDMTKRYMGIVGSALLVSMGAGGMAALADGGPTSQDANQPATDEMRETVADAGMQRVANVRGTFSFTQDEVADTATIARALGGSDASAAPQVLCGAQGAPQTDVAAEDWTISVGGLVDNPYAMTVAELQDDPDVQRTLMGCSCAGNPADGKASVNAQVTGVSVTTLLRKAGVGPAANTIVFTSADGYEVALPLLYVESRMCPIVFDVNGSPIAESVGGTNQLWLGATSARYFARDIVSITLESRDEVPAAPGTPEAGDTYANLPNVGVAFGGEVA